MGTPQRAILKRSNARSCFEPHRSRDPAGGRFARKPTNGGRAFWRPPTGPRDATSNTRASASDPHSGQYGAVLPQDEQRMPRPGWRLLVTCAATFIVVVGGAALTGIDSGLIA